MIRDRTIVCVASNWSDPPTSKHHVMRRLAQHNHVIWINYHASRRPNLSTADARLALRRLGQVLSPPTRGESPVTTVTPLLIPLPGSRLVRWLNAWLLRRTVGRATRGAPQRPCQLWLFTPDVPELIEQFDWERVVYYCVDEFSAFAGYDARLTAHLEACTLAASDVVVTTSQPLFDQRRGRHANVHVVSHGVDFEHFASARRFASNDVPPDAAGLSAPVFGYFGLIDEYVDVDLIAAAAAARPNWSFLMIGDVRCDVAMLRRRPNVRLLGRRSYEDLPKYCAAFDAGMIPFRSSRLTHAVNPLKLREYLAAGLPVLSAPLPEVLNYAPAVRMVTTVQQFIAAGESLPTWRADPAVRAVQDRIRNEGWDARVAELTSIVMGAPRLRPVAEAGVVPAVSFASKLQ